jgi:hypothetical protein
MAGFAWRSLGPDGRDSSALVVDNYSRRYRAARTCENCQLRGILLSRHTHLQVSPLLLVFRDPGIASSGPFIFARP